MQLRTNAKQCSSDKMLWKLPILCNLTYIKMIRKVRQPIKKVKIVKAAWIYSINHQSNSLRNVQGQTISFVQSHLIWLLVPKQQLNKTIQKLLMLLRNMCHPKDADLGLTRSCWNQGNCPIIMNKFVKDWTIHCIYHHRH